MADNISIWGQTPKGEDVHLIVLKAHGYTAKIMSYGATLIDWRFDDLNYSVVLGLNTLEEYIAHDAYLGACISRVINRIGQGQFELGSKIYALDKNEADRQMLHGGADGGADRNWRLVDAGDDFVTFTDHLPDGHMGFPGAMDIELTYRLNSEGLALDFKAKTDAPTLCNLGHHSYFNLDGGATIHQHTLQIAADHMLEVDAFTVPTGTLLPVEKTPFDMRQSVQMGEVLAATAIDHNFCLSNHQTALRDIAKVTGETGITLSIATTEPGLQVYDGAGLSGVQRRGGVQPFAAHAGLALEPQGWPDAIHHPHFPNTVLNPGETYQQKSVFRLSRGPNAV